MRKCENKKLLISPSYDKAITKNRPAIDWSENNFKKKSFYA